MVYGGLLRCLVLWFLAFLLLGMQGDKVACRFIHTYTELTEVVCMTVCIISGRI